MLVAALALAAAEPQMLAWQGSGEVYPDGKPLALGIRTRIQRNGEVLSESWPVAQGQEKGMHRLRLTANGDTMEVGGRAQAAPPEMASEERKQFGFYWQLQEAIRRAAEVAHAGANTFSVDGPVRTWFRLAPDGTLQSAQNLLPADTPGSPVFQTFRFIGWLQDNGALFPRRMEMSRDGKPYFTLDVAKFDAD